MTLLERLQINKGGLLRLKTELFWYGDRVWDGNPGRVCLLLDAAAEAARATAGVRFGLPTLATEADGHPALAVALLLIDGSPQWIWVAEADVEMIVDG